MQKAGSGPGRISGAQGCLSWSPLSLLPPISGPQLCPDLAARGRGAQKGSERSRKEH